MEKGVYEQFEITNRTIEVCDKRQKEANIDVTPEQLEMYFEKSGLTWQHAMLASTYIGMRNDDLCSADARKELLFRASAFDKAMESVDRKIRIETDDGELTYTDLWSMALLPTLRGTKIALQYEQFPLEVKEYMETHFGSVPFEYKKFMNGLSEGK